VIFFAPLSRGNEKNHLQNNVNEFFHYEVRFVNNEMEKRQEKIISD